jgi:hypothetical protein
MKNLFLVLVVLMVAVWVLSKSNCARCNDGTYSSSSHRQGTCSHHGGVAEWYC